MDPAPPAPSPKPFGPLRGLLWPIHRHELKKLLPMLLLFFFISFVYSILRNTKDTLVVTAPGGGASLIPFLKVYGVFPMAIGFMLGYAKLSNVLNKEQIFYASLAPFAGFFLLFAALFPLRAVLHPAALDPARRPLTPWLANLLGLGRIWLFSLFYVMSELWASMALSLSFWGFANDVVKLEESRRFYALFGVGANLALLTVRPANQGLHWLEARLVAVRPMEPWTAYVALLMALVLACILVIALIYRWIQRAVLTDPRLYTPADQSARKRLRPRMSLPQAFRFLARSRYLLLIAVLVVGYGVTTNLIEVTWKTHLARLHPDPTSYQDYMADFAFATGAATLFMMLFVANNVIRRFGWTVAALFTPVVFLVTGCGFFGFLLLEDGLGPLLAAHGTTPLALAVLFGAIQNVASKATKYALFDPTKEMAYIPLDQESKVKGKAAIDVVGHRLGKAGGALLNQALIGLFHSLRAVPGLIALLVMAMLGGWIWAGVELGRAFQKRVRDQADRTREAGSGP
jgi:AAA family ATP:ADP antiporter